MRVFLDSCVIIECFAKNNCDEMISLRHLKNWGVELVTSITVLGECLDQCVKKGFDPLELLRFIESLRINAAYPEDDLRLVCIEVDGHLSSIGRYGSSCTDRTHFAYAIVTHCDYYATSAGEKRTLDCPPLREGWVRTAPTTVSEIKNLLRKGRSKGTVAHGPVPMLLKREDATCESSTA